MAKQLISAADSSVRAVGEAKGARGAMPIGRQYGRIGNSPSVACGHAGRSYPRVRGGQGRSGVNTKRPTNLQAERRTAHCVDMESPDLVDQSFGLNQPACARLAWRPP
jgi:hypothetical protein